METTISKFPPEWRSLFSVLSCRTTSDDCAELWVLENLQSRLGEMVSWEQLVTRLAEPEPCISDSGQLTFVPRLLVFPTPLQSKILSFVHQQRKFFPSRALLHLVDMIKRESLMDDGIKQKMQEIAKYCGSELNLDTDNVYRFTESNGVGVKDLVDALNTKTSPSDKTPAMELEEDMIIELEDQDKEECITTDNNVDVDDVLTTKKVHFVVAEGPYPSQTQRRKALPRSQRLEMSFLSQRTRVRFLGEDKQDMFDDIKESWDRQQKASSESIQLFTLCNQTEMVEVCKHLKLSSAEEGVTVTACEQFISLAQQISYSSAVCFATSAVFPAVMRAEQLTRPLMLTLLSYTKAFPKQSVDGILVPCSISDKANALHSDLLLKIFCESFGDEDKEYYVKTFLEQAEVLSEHMVPVLQQLFNSQMPLDSENLSQCVRLFERSSLPMSKNLKFAKLLSAFISRYSNEFSATHVNSLRQAAESNTTFMKKSCLAALKKLQT